MSLSDGNVFIILSKVGADIDLATVAWGSRDYSSFQ